MASRADIGEMRTVIHIKRITAGSDSEGTPTEVLTDIFGGGKVWCKWVWNHGTEALESERTEHTEKAVVTMHYSPLVRQTDLVFRGSDRYEITSYNNVEDRNEYLELFLERTVKA